MANPEHLKVLRQGVEQWNRWVEEPVEAHVGAVNLRWTRQRNADLTEADLSLANLSGANFEKANFGGASLVEARLMRTNLREANLARANLSRADLAGADFGGLGLFRSSLAEANLDRATLVEANLSGTDLRGANLSRANLYMANLGDAVLHQTNFGEALLSATVFANVDLSVANGLETVKHGGPSYIDIHTIYKSGGKIPEVFLRGCGVPDDMIGYIKSIAGAIQYYSLFISYSTKDQEFAERLHADLQAKGVRCWFAPHDVKGGRKIHEQIDEAIRLHDRLLLILSEDSMKSEWVKTELAKARKREGKDGKRVLFPVRLVGFEALRDWECFDADTGKDSAREIREYFIPDFSSWKEHDSYRVAFDRLVKDLKAGDSG